MFGKEKKDTQPQVPTPQISTPFDIGKNGTVEALYAANQTADDVNRIELRKGARAAFLEGRPENLQTILSNHTAFGMKYVNVRNMFYLLIDGQNDPATVLSLTLDKTPAPEKQALLNETLYAVVNGAYDNKDSALIAALLGAGANANAEFTGSPGRILAIAIDNAYPPSVIKLLYDNGASFKDAALRINTKSYWDEGNKRATCIGKLKAYREEITGEPATEEGELKQMMLKMQAQLDTLTKKFNTAQQPAAQPEEPARAPKEKQAARKYPAVVTR